MRPARESARRDTLDRLTALLDGPERPSPAPEHLPRTASATLPLTSEIDEPAQAEVARPRVARPMVLDAAVVRIVAGLVILALVAAGVAGFLFFRGRPGGVSAPRPAMSLSGVGPSGVGASGVGASGSGSPTPTVVVVAVAGKVRKPGVVRLPAGSRVVDAIAAAGGALPGTDDATVNLAAKLVDGQQIVVGGAAVGSSGSGAPGGAIGGGPLNLNDATAGQLDGLPGVGPVTAQRIVAWRTAHGGFQRVDQLQDVPGIGPSKFAQLRELLAL